MTRRILPLALLAATMSLTVCVAVQAASHGKPAQADTKHTPETVSPAVRWADSVSAANHQRYCDPNLSPDELMARLDAAPPGSYRTADALLNLPPDFRDKPVETASNKYMTLLAEMDRVHSEYNGLVMGHPYKPDTAFYVGSADHIRIIPVGPGCALSRTAGLTRNSLSDYPDLNKIHLPLGRGPQTLDYAQRLVDTQFLPHDPVDEIYYGGVEPTSYKVADYLVIFVSGLSRPFTFDAIAYLAKGISISQGRIEAINANLVKKFPITIHEVRLKHDDGDVIPTLGVANDLDTYYQLRARAFHDTPPDTKRKLFTFSNEPDELGKAEARNAMMSQSLVRHLPVEERSHICVAPKATCRLDHWTPLGQACVCQYVTGQHIETQLVDFGSYTQARDIAINDYANSNGRVVSETKK